MATAPPSSKGKTRGPTGGRGVAVAAGTPAAEAAPEANARVRSSLRRVPTLVWALGGAIVGGGYGHFVLGMRLGPPLVMVALGGLTLVLSAAALWRVVDPLTRGDQTSAAEARGPLRVRELEREKQVVLKAIKEIELDYQMRKISETDYKDMVERYRARALRIMGDLALGDDFRALIERELKDRVAAARMAAGATESAAERPVARPATHDDSDDAKAAPPPAAALFATAAEAAPASTTPALASPSPAVCGACATTNDTDARFCKQCGQKLNASSAPG